MGRIARLDPLVSTQIAAGEVVERPASAVKELVENSLDAGATRITVDFEEGGVALMRVSDDGVGMPPDDASLSLERFATSKLSSVDDLSRIASMGFRGEALPSIASCSRLTLETRAKGHESGTEVSAEGGVMQSITEKGLPQGTTVTVRDLFFNTPARLRFVKSRASERQSIIDVVMRLALAWPDVSFTLRTGGRTIFATTGQGLANAVADVFGPQEASAMAEVRYSEGEVLVSGFAGLPSLYRRQRDRQIFSVNSRPVRDIGLGWALDQAYAGLIPPKTYPMAILDIGIPPEEVDVNVHPTKSQVKFRSEQDVKRAVSRAVSEALSRAGLRPTQDAHAGRAILLPPSAGWSVARDSGIGHEQRGGQTPPSYRRALPHMGGGACGFSGPQSTALTEGSLWDAGHGDAIDSSWEYLGSVADTYLVASTGDSVLIIDKHALMESLTYRAMLHGQSGSQDLLMAEMLRLDPREIAAYEDFEEALAGVGFGCRLVGDRTVLVTSVPMVLGRALHPSSLKEMLSKLSQDSGQVRTGRTREEAPSVSPERLLDSARIETAACHASIRAGETLTSEEARSLIASLREQPDARTCPHGRPVIRELTLKEIGDFFGRTSHAG